MFVFLSKFAAFADSLKVGLGHFGLGASMPQVQEGDEKLIMTGMSGQLVCNGLL